MDYRQDKIMIKVVLFILILGIISVSGCTQTADGGQETHTYSLADVALHSSQGDCWLIIHDKVYDVSNFVTHPGKEAILEGCGIDATELFETRPMGSGTPHSENARDYMESYYIGDLA